jgi:hypothetical protein
MTPQPLPLEFVFNHVSLTWRELLWGYEHGWADWTCLRELAVRQLCNEEQSKPALVELAGLLDIDASAAGGLARTVAMDEPTAPEDDIRKKWLFLILLWIFENRDHFIDPLDLVEEIFCDFDHPLDIVKFIRYMPAQQDYDPRQHSTAENEERLLTYWREYLTNAERLYGNGHQG